MGKKDLASVMPPESLEQLVHAVDVLRRAEDTRYSVQTEESILAGQGRLLQSWGDDIGGVEVYGVRDAKTSLSTILNEVAQGHLAFIEAGKGGAVVMMSTDALAEAVSVLEKAGAPTLRTAFDGLPFRGPITQVQVRGRRPVRGMMSRIVSGAPVEHEESADEAIEVGHSYASS